MDGSRLQAAHSPCATVISRVEPQEERQVSVSVSLAPTLPVRDDGAGVDTHYFIAVSAEQTTLGINRAATAPLILSVWASAQFSLDAHRGGYHGDFFPSHDFDVDEEYVASWYIDRHDAMEADAVAEFGLDGDEWDNSIAQEDSKSHAKAELKSRAKAELKSRAKNLLNSRAKSSKSRGAVPKDE